MYDGWIKVSRKMMEWEWYKDGPTMRVFLHLLLNATSKPIRYKGVDLMPGEYATTYRELAIALDLTPKQVRTAIGHIKGTGEVTLKGTPSMPIYYINNYSKYQEKTGGGHTSGHTFGPREGTPKGTQNKNIYKQEEQEYKEQESGTREVKPSAADIERITEIPAGYKARFGDNIDAFREWMRGQGVK